CDLGLVAPLLHLGQRLGRVLGRPAKDREVITCRTDVAAEDHTTRTQGRPCRVRSFEIGRCWHKRGDRAVEVEEYGLGCVEQLGGAAHGLALVAMVSQMLSNQS